MPLLPRRDADPPFLFAYLHLVKTRPLQTRLQFNVLVDGHAADDPRPPLVLVRIAIALVADKDCPAWLQRPPDLAEASGQIRPEIDGLKGRGGIEAAILKRHIRHAALQNGATPLLNCSSVELPGLLHADGRIVDALDDAMRAFFQQPFYVRPAAAAAIQNLGVWRKP